MSGRTVFMAPASVCRVEAHLLSLAELGDSRCGAGFSLRGASAPPKRHRVTRTSIDPVLHASEEDARASAGGPRGRSGIMAPASVRRPEAHLDPVLHASEDAGTIHGKARP